MVVEYLLAVGIKEMWLNLHLVMLPLLLVSTYYGQLAAAGRASSNETVEQDAVFWIACRNFMDIYSNITLISDATCQMSQRHLQLS